VTTAPLSSWRTEELQTKIFAEENLRSIRLLIRSKQQYRQILIIWTNVYKL